MEKKEVLRVFPERLQRLLQKEVNEWDNLQEIRLRNGMPVMIVEKGEKRIPGQDGQVVTEREFREVIEKISNYSLYAFEEELKRGFLTIPGGHRVGVAGKAVLEQGKVKTLRNLSSLNVRLAHEIRGCADRIMPYLYEERRFLSTLIVSPPGGGKTTLLRDIIRNVAKQKKVSVIDERSEIAACYQGIPQNDMGRFCDVLDTCPKAEGIVMMVRSLSPEVIAVDEIGTDKENEALRYALTSGCALLASVHGDSLSHVREKMEPAMFQRIVLLEGEGHPGKIRKIYDEKGQVIGC